MPKEIRKYLVKSKWRMRITHDVDLVEDERAVSAYDPFDAIKQVHILLNAEIEGANFPGGVEMKTISVAPHVDEQVEDNDDLLTKARARKELALARKIELENEKHAEDVFMRGMELGLFSSQVNRLIAEGDYRGIISKCEHFLEANKDR